MSQNNFHPIILYCEDIKDVHDALISSGHNDLAFKIAKKSNRTKADKKYADAIRLWGDRAFDIDDDPVVAKAGDGAHVMVWQWVDKDEIYRKDKK